MFRRVLIRKAGAYSFPFFSPFLFLLLIFAFFCKKKRIHSGRQRPRSPAEAEGQGSRPIMDAFNIRQSMRECRIKTKQNNNQVNNNILGGGWKARGIPKGSFGRVLARNAKKGEKFSSAGSTGLTALSFFSAFLGHSSLHLLRNPYSSPVWFGAKTTLPNNKITSRRRQHTTSGQWRRG
jgi:hypothetical protein